MLFSRTLAMLRAFAPTFSAIWNKGIPESGCQPTSGPTLERYGPDFNPMTGLGGFEIWVPIEGRRRGQRHCRPFRPNPNDPGMPVKLRRICARKSADHPNFTWFRPR